MRVVSLPNVATLLCALTAVFCAAACSSSTPVTDAPLDMNQQRELHMRLTGTWEHTHYADDDGQREPIDEAKTRWTFHREGDGTYEREAGDDAAPERRSFRWQLEGANIRIDPESGETTYFRVDEWENGEMTWFYYDESERWVVERPRGAER